MFLTEKQSNVLEVLFGRTVESASMASMQVRDEAFVLAKSELANQKVPGRHLSLREVLDLGLDRVLLMSRVGAFELITLLNQKLPPVWPGEASVELQLETNNIRIIAWSTV